MKKWLRDIWLDYKSEVFFGLGLAALVVLSYWGSAFIPEPVFENYINPIEYISTAVICFYGAFLLFTRRRRNALQRSWTVVLLSWGIIEVLLWIMRFLFHITAVGGTPHDPLYCASVVVGNILAFMLYIYPTQLLCPGWINWWRAALLLLPSIMIGLVDYFVPFNLLPLIMLYPFIILVLLCRHIRRYRRWCEDNFSSMEDIDVQWIVRYLTMLFICGASFYFIVFCYVPNRMFTQEWLLLLILAWTTERVLSRPDPWAKMLKEEETDTVEHTYRVEDYPRYKILLEAWIAEEKPYLNADFQLMDLHKVLPVNRTYLSQFINTVYGCSFYQWVNTLRIEEAKRMMTEEPDAMLQEIADRCGFASRQVFTRNFARETGSPPSEWRK